MKIQSVGNSVYVKGVTSLNLDQTLDCGQAFRWEKQTDGSYTGVAMGRVINACMQDDVLVLHNCSEADFYAVWKRYFDLDRSYELIKQTLSADPVLSNAIKYGEGIRLLNQDAWECIVSFIISASNNIPRIKKIINLLCQHFGSKLEYNGKVYHAFPSAQDIAKLSLNDLSVIRAGFRDKYILEAAKSVSSGETDINLLKTLDASEAKKRLMRIHGVGDKVASCVLLFGLGKHECFPIDVWIKRITEHLYFEGEQSVQTIAGFAQDRFGDLGGYAQQYLFYYARENKLGIPAQEKKRA